MVREALERLWKDTCTIIEYQEYTKANKSIGHRETVILENQPCKLSFSTLEAANQIHTAAILAQKVKLFITPEIVIKPGSKIMVFRNGVHLGDYSKSGESGRFSNHQEITLELFKGWA